MSSGLTVLVLLQGRQEAPNLGIRELQEEKKARTTDNYIKYLLCIKHCSKHITWDVLIKPQKQQQTQPYAIDTLLPLSPGEELWLRDGKEFIQALQGAVEKPAFRPKLWTLGPLYPIFPPYHRIGRRGWGRFTVTFRELSNHDMKIPQLIKESSRGNINLSGSCK